MSEKEKKIRELKNYFEERDDVVMAFIFGSRAKGRERLTSDWDVAVYLKAEDREIEQGLWDKVEAILGSETDVVVLNRAPAVLAWTILRTGLPLVIKSRLEYLRLLKKTGHEANAWYRTARRYHQIFERSSSLSEEDRNMLRRTIQFLVQEVSDYEKFRKLTWQEYESDRAKKREVERWAEQLVNAVIDAAEVVLASERRVIPETYRQIVRALGTIPPFDQKEDLYEKLAQWTELRNILAHEYLDYRWKELARFIQESEPTFLSLIKHLTSFLGEKE